MKKIAYLIGAALMIAGMFASCSLDSMSLTEKDTTNFPKTAEDANQALAAIYQNLNNVNAFPQQSSCIIICWLAMICWVVVVPMIS